MSENVDSATPPDTGTGPEALASPGEVVRAKGSMDGATTLEAAAEMLEGQAAWLRTLHNQGWTLQSPVEDDYGFLVDPTGNAGRDDTDDDDV